MFYQKKIMFVVRRERLRFPTRAVVDVQCVCEAHSQSAGIFCDPSITPNTPHSLSLTHTHVTDLDPQ